MKMLVGVFPHFYVFNTTKFLLKLIIEHVYIANFSNCSLNRNREVS